VIYFAWWLTVVAGSVKNTATFELVKLKIRTLLEKRNRQDLIPGWDEFLDKFPDSVHDDKVPFEDIYGELLDKYRNLERYFLISI
jgi:hypothetical protein